MIGYKNTIFENDKYYSLLKGFMPDAYICEYIIGQWTKAKYKSGLFFCNTRDYAARFNPVANFLNPKTVVLEIEIESFAPIWRVLLPSELGPGGPALPNFFEFWKDPREYSLKHYSTLLPVKDIFYTYDPVFVKGVA